MVRRGPRRAGIGVADEAYDWRFYAAAGLGLFLAGEALALAGVPESSGLHQGLFAAFLAALGLLCLRNARACGARHCSVTGWGYLVLAAAALLVAAGAAPFGTDLVWIGFGVVVVLGIALAAQEDPAAGV